MKLSDLAKGARPIFCRFDDPDDTHGGVIAKEPSWEEDNYNSDREIAGRQADVRRRAVLSCARAAR